MLLAVNVTEAAMVIKAAFVEHTQSAGIVRLVSLEHCLSAFKLTA